MEINLKNYLGYTYKTNFDKNPGTAIEYVCICNVDSSSTLQPNVAKCPVHYTKHPLYPGFQTQFTFKIGIYEPHFNKKIIY